MAVSPRRMSNERQAGEPCRCCRAIQPEPARGEQNEQGLKYPLMKRCRILVVCMLASFCLLSGGALGQVVTEFSAGISANAAPQSITAGPDGNLWFTEFSIDR